MTPSMIKQKVVDNFSDALVEVLDTTGMGNNFIIIFSNYNFAKSRLETHREIMRIFSEELKSGAIHALSIKMKT